jgi:hypothetical protein
MNSRGKRKFARKWKARVLIGCSGSSLPKKKSSQMRGIFIYLNFKRENKIWKKNIFKKN